MNVCQKIWIFHNMNRRGKEFEKWLKREGLSASSAQKYRSAVVGSISKWAVDAALINQSIVEIIGVGDFARFNQQIRSLPIFIRANTRGNNMYGSALNKYAEFLKAKDQSTIGSELKEIFENPVLDETEKVTLVSARLGQGRFRSELLKIWGGCVVTGYSDQRLLVASHIRPWAQSSNEERLDKYNGLVLIPNLDKAFDIGLISFSNAGKILFSPSLADRIKLSFSDTMKIEPKDQNLSYLEYHRDEIFIRV